MTDHIYRANLAWSGSTANYADYDRTHLSDFGQEQLSLSADPAFLGNAALPNPEQLLVAAASSCQLLSFLGAASRSGVDVISYTDRALGEMSEMDQPARVQTITLRPQIEARGATESRIERLLHKAHQQCYIANSLTTTITLEPTIHIL